MSKAIRIHATGGPEVMVWEDAPVGDPRAGEVRLRQIAVGLNFLDIYHRAGTHHMPLDPLPATPGVEGAGVVTAVGEGADFAIGDRVAYPITVGAYAEERIIAADDLVPVPGGISYVQAAALMLKGLTTAHLFGNVANLSRGDRVLFHAAAGGVGLIACQWARHLGVELIGTVGSDEKAEIARAQGCAHTIVYGREDFAARVGDIAGGKGVQAVFDSVGQDTFMGSLACAAEGATVATFGLASGPLPAFGFADLPLGVSVCRASVRSVTDHPARMREAAAAMFGLVSEGHITPVIGGVYNMADAPAAHREMEARRTTGSIVFVLASV